MYAPNGQFQKCDHLSAHLKPQIIFYNLLYTTANRAGNL